MDIGLKKADEDEKQKRSFSVTYGEPFTSSVDKRFPPVLVMFHPSMKKLAEKLVQATDARMRLQSNVNLFTCTSVPFTVDSIIHSQVQLQYRPVEVWNHVSWEKFKDGWPNIFIDDVHTIAGKDGKLIQETRITVWNRENLCILQ